MKYCICNIDVTHRECVNTLQLNTCMSTKTCSHSIVTMKLLIESFNECNVLVIDSEIIRYTEVVTQPHSGHYVLIVNSSIIQWPLMGENVTGNWGVSWISLSQMMIMRLRESLCLRWWSWDFLNLCQMIMRLRTNVTTKGNTFVCGCKVT